MIRHLVRNSQSSAAAQRSFQEAKDEHGCLSSFECLLGLADQYASCEAVQMALLSIRRSLALIGRLGDFFMYVPPWQLSANRRHSIEQDRNPGELNCPRLDSKGDPLHNLAL